MKQFSQTPQCEKCMGMDINRRYHGPCEVDQREYLDSQCMACMYEWEERVATYVPPMTYTWHDRPLEQCSDADISDGIANTHNYCEGDLARAMMAAFTTERERRKALK